MTSVVPPDDLVVILNHEIFMSLKKLLMLSFVCMPSLIGVVRAHDQPIDLDDVKFLNMTGDDRVILEFYKNLAQGKLEAVQPLVMSHESNGKAEGAYVFGSAVARSASILGFSSLPRIAGVTGIHEGFKAMTGQDVVTYRLYIVRYEYSAEVMTRLKARGATPANSLNPFEVACCDLWIQGSDGKWRVVCDYYPGARIDSQTLGLALTNDEKLAETRRDEVRKEKLRDEFSIFGIKETKE